MIDIFDVISMQILVLSKKHVIASKETAKREKSEKKCVMTKFRWACFYPAIVQDAACHYLGECYMTKKYLLFLCVTLILALSLNSKGKVKFSTWNF